MVYPLLSQLFNAFFLQSSGKNTTFWKLGGRYSFQPVYNCIYVQCLNASISSLLSYLAFA